MKKNLLKIAIIIIIIILNTDILINGIEKKVTSGDLVLIINGLNVHVDDDAKEVLTSLGNDYTFEEAISCAYKGMDKSFSYDGIEISTLPIDDRDKICEVYVTSDKYETLRGIKVGLKKSDIEETYGKDYTFEDSVLTYWIDEKGDPKSPKLYFVLDENNIITAISIFSAKNSGR
ncbi:MAG: hypothetical protein FWC47_04460 [Oscillospiraceae bacterium]|nr:hypothetical protein [Oscillospiraceae bacterium]